MRIYGYLTPYMPKVTELTIGAGHYSLGNALVPGSTFSNKAASYHVNSRGFRGPEFAMPKPEGTYRIFALGGSTTFGIFPATTSDTTTYPAVLQVLLNANKPEPAIKRYEVVNAGVPGYSTRTSTTNFHARILHLQPDAIIIYHNTNDLARYGDEEQILYPLMNQFVPRGFAVELFDHIFGWSYAVQELRFTIRNRLNFDRMTPGSADLRGRTEWTLDTRYLEAFRRDLRNLVILAKANNVMPVLATQSIAFSETTDFSRLTEDEIKMRFQQPWDFYRRIPPEQRFPMFRRYNDIIREVALQEHVLLADVNAAIPKTSEYHYDYCHLTDRGSALQAAIIHAALLNTGASKKMVVSGNK